MFMQAAKTSLIINDMTYFRCFPPMEWRHFCLQDAFVWFCSVKCLDIDTGQTKFLHASGESRHKSLIRPFFDLSDRQSVPHSDATDLDPSSAGGQGYNPICASMDLPCQSVLRHETESLLAPVVLFCSWPWPSFGGGRESRHFPCGD